MARQGLVEGTTYLLIAQIAFILSGYLIHIGLGRYLGPADYGIYSVIIYIATVFNLFLTTGLPTAASKYISEHEEQLGEVMRTSLSISLILSVAISSMLFFEADVMAKALNDLSLTPFIRLVSMMMPGYALFMMIRGYYNGVRNYKMQAALMLLYDIFKPVMIFSFVLMGLSAWGAVLGFVLAPLFPLAAGIYLMDFRAFRGKAFPLKKILDFAVPIIIFSVTINLIMSLDLFFVKRVLMENEIVGFYSAASMIAKVPYTLMGAVTLALFPAVSASIGRPEKIREYISESLRYTLYFIVPVTFMVAASSGSLVSLIYSESYRPAGEALMVLIIGASIFAVFSLLTTIISGSGRPLVAMLFSIVILAMDVILNQLMVPVWGMTGAAGATSVSSALGLVLAAGYVYRRHESLTSAASVAKILLASLLLYVAISFADLEGASLLLGYAAAGMLYMAILFMMGEVKQRDVERLRRLLRHRPPA